MSDEKRKELMKSVHEELSYIVNDLDMMLFISLFYLMFPFNFLVRWYFQFKTNRLSMGFNVREIRSVLDTLLLIAITIWIVSRFSE